MLMDQSTKENLVGVIGTVQESKPMLIDQRTKENLVGV